MEDFTFTNNAGEQFDFFTNEEGNICLNIRYKKELISCFILNKTEAEDLKTFLTENIKNKNYDTNG